MRASMSQPIFAAAICVISSGPDVSEAWTTTTKALTLRIVRGRNFNNIRPDDLQPIQALEDLLNLARCQPADFGSAQAP